MYSKEDRNRENVDMHGLGKFEIFRKSKGNLIISALKLENDVKSNFQNIMEFFVLWIYLCFGKWIIMVRMELF